MCGRYSQSKRPHRYAEALASQLPLRTLLTSDPLERYNLPPTSPSLLFRQEEEALRADSVPWGYAPFWARGKRPPAINARVETAAMSKFFRDIWKTGRALVPADGWYEWKKDPDNPKVKQPYFIQLASGEPCFFAAIGRYSQDEPRDGDGFVIITASSDEGMVDIHDRRPVVLSPEIAREWLDPSLPPERAEELAIYHCEPCEAFGWYPVSKAVGSVRNNGAQLLERISDPLL